jgi:hypothetical protein
MFPFQLYILLTKFLIHLAVILFSKQSSDGKDPLQPSNSPGNQVSSAMEPDPTVAPSDNATHDGPLSPSNEGGGDDGKAS